MINETELMKNELLEVAEEKAAEANDYSENLKEAELSGSKDMAEYYRQKELQRLAAEQTGLELDEKLNPKDEDEFGSSCGAYCQKTNSSSSDGNYSSYH